ncbi:hypothetical protein R3P38DRAFT_2729323 [Favolaschia claudopus]|uniref:Stealth protein CR3 conserved region 3 domain-containing protein n=1 Tax=Favolaschia claudopus TaxID=2862362 RepID=A0AAW0ABF2_9AGAR
MAILPIRSRSYYICMDKGRQSRIRRLPASRVAFFVIFALSLTSVLLAWVRYSSLLTHWKMWSRGPVYDSFIRPSAEDATANTTIRPIKSHLRIPDACLDHWVSYGRWDGSCAGVPIQESTIDLVYIWVNGSDKYHAESRQDVLASLKISAADSRFREHDELRYSLRSAFKNLGHWKNSAWHVVTADVPTHGPFQGDAQRLGLVPQWLDVDRARIGGVNGEPPIYLYHDSEVFRYTSSPGHTPTVEEVNKWRQSVLPTFNSMAVESQLPHLDPESVSENIIYLNDDQFFMLPFPSSAFHSPLYGPVFRLVTGFMVQGNPSGEGDSGGEWRSLGWSSHVLDQRFGIRARAYVAHNARSFSLPLLHEAALTFGDAFALTPMSRFRGSHSVSGEYEINTIYLATHFVMERHREALLWSWVVGKWGGMGDGGGVLDRNTKDGMWAEIGGRHGEEEVKMRRSSGRTTNEDVAFNMRSAGLAQPRSEDPEKQANTTYLFVSNDGFTPNYMSRPEEATISRNDCMGSETETAWAVFRRLAAEKPHCGDAVIALLANAAPNGLSIFLPPPSPSSSSSDIPMPAVLPLIMPSSPPPLPQNSRAFALRLIHRYAYTIAETPSEFFGVETGEQAMWYLSWVRPDTALLCVNDDLADDAWNVTQGSAQLQQWFQSKWPDKLAYEI